MSAHRVSIWRLTRFDNGRARWPPTHHLDHAERRGCDCSNRATGPRNARRAAGTRYVLAASAQHRHTASTRPRGSHGPERRPMDGDPPRAARRRRVGGGRGGRARRADRRCPPERPHRHHRDERAAGAGGRGRCGDRGGAQRAPAGQGDRVARSSLRGRLARRPAGRDAGARGQRFAGPRDDRGDPARFGSDRGADRPPAGRPAAPLRSHPAPDLGALRRRNAKRAGWTRASSRRSAASSSCGTNSPRSPSPTATGSPSATSSPARWSPVAVRSRNSSALSPTTP